MCFMSFILTFLLIIFSLSAIAQTLTTDSADYQPGSTVTITGSGFDANETVTLQVLHTDSTPPGGAAHSKCDMVTRR